MIHQLNKEGWLDLSNIFKTDDYPEEFPQDPSEEE
jgi:hypothetical protein